MRRRLVRPLVWGLLLIIALLAGLLAFINSRYARQQVAALLRAGLTDATGRPVRLGAVDYELLPLSLSVRDLVIPGPTAADPPVAVIPRARIEVAWNQLRRKVVQVEQIDLVAPVFYLQLNRDGSSNLPPFGGRPGAAPSRFELHIGHLLVRRGVFRLNERRSELEVDAREVGVAGEEIGKRRLGVLLMSQRMVARLPGSNVSYPLAVSARGTLDLGAGRMELARVRLAWPELAAIVDGSIGWRGGARVELGVSARGEARWLNRMGYMQEPIEGPVEIDGRFTHASGSWSYGGTLGAPRVAVLHRLFQGLEARFSGGEQRLEFEVRRARYADGEIAGKVTVETGARPGPRGGRPVALDLGLTGLALQPLLTDQFPAQFAPPRQPSLPVVQFAGRASGRLRYSFASPEPMLGTGTLDLKVQPAPYPFVRGGGLPIAGDVPLELARGLLSAERVELTAPGQRATISGFRFDLVRQSGRLDYRLETQSTGALLPLLPPEPRPAAVKIATKAVAAGVRGGVAPAGGAVAAGRASEEVGGGPVYPAWLPSAGRGTIVGAVAIERAGYRAEVALDLAGVEGELGTADRLHGSLAVGPLAVEELRLEATRGDGAMMVTGRVVMPVDAARGRPRQPARLELAIDAAQWPASALVRFLPAGMPTRGLAGGASGRLDLVGDPDHLSGRAEADIQNLELAGLRLGRAKGLLSFDPGRVAVDGGLLDTPAGRVLVRGSLDRVHDGVELALDAPSLALAAEPLAGLLRHAVTGRATVMAALTGTLERPQGTFSLRIAGLAAGGRPLAAETGSNSAKAAPAETQALLTWDGETLHANGSIPGLLSFGGGGRLNRSGAALELAVASSNLPGLVGIASPRPLPAQITGSATGQLSLRADFGEGSRGSFGGELRLADLRVEYAGKRLVNREPVVVELAPERLEIRSFYLGEPGTPGALGVVAASGVPGPGSPGALAAERNELVLSGSIGIAARPVTLDLRAQGTVAASWVALAAPTVDLTGTINALATVRGTVDDPQLTGQGELRGGRLIVPGFNNAFEGMEGVFLLYSDRLVLDGLRARVGGGTVRANGQLALPGAGRDLSYRLDVVASDVSVRYPECCISRGNAQFAVTSTSLGRQITGAVQLDRLIYSQNFDVDALQLVLRSLRRERLQVAETGGVLSTTQINLVIHGPGVLRVNNNVADLRGSVELSILGSVARPVVFGSIQLEPGGSLVYADNRYTVERGGLTFSNPNRLDPIVDLVLRTEVQSFDITLNLSGTLDHLSAKFSSSADLADLDILALLAGGQRAEGEIGPPRTPLSAADTNQASQAVAAGFLAGQAASALTSRVGKLFGLDRFRIDPLSARAGQSVQGVAFTAGKRLSKRLFVTYSNDPSSTVPTVWQVEYKAGRNVKVLLTYQSGRGAYALDVQWERRF